MNNDTNFDCLFTPFSIGKMEIKNRLVMSPMGTYAALMDGSVSDTLATYFEERAKGGVGAIITASQYLTPKLAQGIYGTYFDSKRIIPHLSGMTERIHCYGAKAIAQISAGTGRNAHPSQCGGVPFSASAVPAVFNPNILCRPLTIEEIKDIMKSWQLAAEIAANAGYDAIEVHGHVGYIIDQFLTPLWNHREDEYGGSDENRARFAIEILEAIKRGAGDDMPVIYRISMDHRIPGGRTLDDSKRLIKILGEHGVDAFDVDCGCYEHPDFVYPTFYRGDACMEYVCDTAREATDKPILNSGNHTPETAKRLIESGRADFAMMGRPLIADPELPKKLMENREEDVRPCIRCNEGCLERTFFQYKAVTCAVNPIISREGELEIKPAENKRRIAVIGGGPGGMEAARVLKLRGHDVTIFEKAKLGGQLIEAAVPEFKADIRPLTRSLITAVEKLQVPVIQKEAQAADLAEYDAVVCATGSVSKKPTLPGIDQPIAVDAFDILNGTKKAGKRVVVLGVGLVGSETALYLAETGHDVTLVGRKPTIMKGVAATDFLVYSERIKNTDMKVCTLTTPLEIAEDGVIVEHKGKSRKIEADTVIYAFGANVEQSLYKELKEQGKEAYLIGDAVHPGKIMDAIHTGYRVGLKL